MWARCLENHCKAPWYEIQEKEYHITEHALSDHFPADIVNLLLPYLVDSPERSFLSVRIDATTVHQSLSQHFPPEIHNLVIYFLGQLPIYQYPRFLTLKNFTKTPYGCVPNVSCLVGLDLSILHLSSHNHAPDKIITLCMERNGVFIQGMEAIQDNGSCSQTGSFIRLLAGDCLSVAIDNHSQPCSSSSYEFRISNLGYETQDEDGNSRWTSW